MLRLPQPRYWFATTNEGTRMQLRPTTDRVRRIQDETAPSYDRRISFFERVLFGGGRRWVCEQA
ncbi:MAG: hypothetical protein EDQ89_04020, partial [Acidobacteria bacterium]